MDAVEFVMERNRMCKTCKTCEGCPGFELRSCLAAEDESEARDVVTAVEQWSKEHPMVTNGQKVREMFPQIEGVSRTKDYVSTAFSKDWWDAEYKGEK